MRLIASRSFAGIGRGRLNSRLAEDVRGGTSGIGQKLVESRARRRSSITQIISPRAL
jgi:hypothetical protein